MLAYCFSAISALKNFFLATFKGSFKTQNVLNLLYSLLPTKFLSIAFKEIHDKLENISTRSWQDLNKMLTRSWQDHYILSQDFFIGTRRPWAQMIRAYIKFTFLWVPAAFVCNILEKAKCQNIKVSQRIYG